MSNTITASADGKSRHQGDRCKVGTLALLSTDRETRVVRIKGRAADICYDWKVEVLGSPIWGVDARTSTPTFTTLPFVSDGALIPLKKGARHV
jgi:hypothetical protein